MGYQKFNVNFKKSFNPYFLFYFVTPFIIKTAPHLNPLAYQRKQKTKNKAFLFGHRPLVYVAILFQYF